MITDHIKGKYELWIPFNPTLKEKEKGMNSIKKRRNTEFRQLIQAMDNDKFKVKRAYLGLVFHGGKQENISAVQSADNLEYEITNPIKKMQTTVKKKVGFLIGHGEVELSKTSADTGSFKSAVWSQDNWFKDSL